MPRPFLTARWANLAIVSYAVPPAMLTPYLPVAPAGSTLEIDTRDDLVAGSRAPQAFVSLVAFEFQQCRVLGIPWPGHTEFAEINLRFYVRAGAIGGSGGQRGVVFIREFVPKPLIAWAAKKFYNEPYVAAPITSRITQDTRTITAEYTLGSPLSRGEVAADGVTHSLRITGRKPVTRPGLGSVEHWFKEQSWGFGMRPGRRSGEPARPLVYEVIHPLWGIYPVESCDVRFDYAAVYGPDWGFLAGTKPVSVVFAAGSEVAVFPPRTQVGVRWSMRTGR